MQERRLTARLARASGAMVLVSCALAMLAGQPGISARAAGPEKKISLHVGAETRESPGREILTAQAIQNMGRREAAGLSVVRPARQTRILGTLAIVQRLILGAVQVSGQGGHSATVLWFEPVCAQVLPPATGAVMGHGERREADRGTPIERQFAITHQLLAPPAA